MIKEREIAIDIIQEFEELLERHNIDIPDKDREGEESEAHIFGTTYYNLEDEIVEILRKDKDELTKVMEEKMEIIKEDKNGLG